MQFAVGNAVANLLKLGARAVRVVVPVAKVRAVESKPTARCCQFALVVIGFAGVTRKPRQLSSLYFDFYQTKLSTK